MQEYATPRGTLEINLSLQHHFLNWFNSFCPAVHLAFLYSRYRPQFWIYIDEIWYTLVFCENDSNRAISQCNISYSYYRMKNFSIVELLSSSICKLRLSLVDIENHGLALVFFPYLPGWYFDLLIYCGVKIVDSYLIYTFSAWSVISQWRRLCKNKMISVILTPEAQTTF